MVLDEGAKLVDQIDAFAEEMHSHAVAQTGHLSFIGDWDDRARAAAEFGKIEAQWQKQHPDQRLPAVARDRGGTAPPTAVAEAPAVYRGGMTETPDIAAEPPELFGKYVSEPPRREIADSMVV